MPSWNIKIPRSDVERVELRAGPTTPKRAAERRAIFGKLKPSQRQPTKATEETQGYRLSFEPSEVPILKERAKACGLSIRDFLTRCLLGRELWLAPGVEEPVTPLPPRPAPTSAEPTIPLPPKPIPPPPPDWHPPEGVQIDVLDGDLRVVTPRHEDFRVGVRELGGQWSRDMGRWILRPDQRADVQALIDKHFR